MELPEPEKAFWSDRPVLVTGATGLVGGWTVRRLLDLGADVTCVVRDHVPQSELQRTLASRVKIAQGDVRDQPFLERVLGEYESTAVIHLAAQTIVGIANRNPVSTFETNVAGTWSLLEAVRRSPRVQSVVVASSDKAYGQASTLPTPESAALDGIHPYDVSKSCADLIARSFALSFGVPVAVTRCGNFYGGGDLNWNRIVPGTLRSLLRGEAPVIRSDGTLVRDYLYVEDAATAYTSLARQLAERPKELAGHAFNFSNEQPLTVLELVEQIRRVVAGPAPRILGEASHEIREQFLDSSKARKQLGWSATWDLTAGLERTTAWYRAFLGGA